MHRHSPVTVQLNAQVSRLAPHYLEPAMLTPVCPPAAITIQYDSRYAGSDEACFLAGGCLSCEHTDERPFLSSSG